jgi:hypothetical protein
VLIVYLCFDSSLSCGLRCRAFHLWGHVSTQKSLGFGAFEFGIFRFHSAILKSLKIILPFICSRTRSRANLEFVWDSSGSRKCSLLLTPSFLLLLNIKQPRIRIRKWVLCNTSYLGGRDRKIQGQCSKSSELSLKNKPKAKGFEGMAQVVEHLPSKSKVLSSVSSLYCQKQNLIGSWVELKQCCNMFWEYKVVL